MTSKEYRKNCDAVLDIYRAGNCDTPTFIQTMRNLVAERDRTLNSMNVSEFVELQPEPQASRFDWQG